MYDTVSLFSALSPASDMPALTGQGIYVLCLGDAGRLPGVAINERRLLYVGMTESGFDARNHFLHKHSGFSTLRRSFGALLKESLALVATPRGPGASRSNVVNYRFSDDGELALSKWMNDNIVVAQMQVADDVATYEKVLISNLEPPLNLTGWSNPNRHLIKTLRQACVREASG